MFRKFDETVQSNKIAKFLFENNFTAMDVNRIYCEVFKCEKLGLEYNLQNLIKETFELKRYSKRSLLNKRLDLNEVAPAQAPAQAPAPKPAPKPAQQNANNQIIKGIQTQITNMLNTINSEKKLKEFMDSMNTYMKTETGKKTVQLQKAAAAPAAAPAAPAGQQQQQQQQQQQVAK
jgi:hypothetical protein